MAEYNENERFETLSDEEIREIRAEMAHYEDASAASVEALKVVQKHRGWVSDASLAEVAGLLGMSPAQLDGVATFYNLIYRQPVGKKVIHYCNSVTCWMLGAEKVRERLCRRLNVELGETSADGEFTVLPIVCLGACDHAPVVMAGEETLLDIGEDDVDRILES
ncbi:MAG: NADH-quinone oxidoreductase subunit NuoE [Pseudomonadota bacterium]